MSNKFKRMLKILLIETIEAEVQLFDTQCPTLIGKRRKRNVVIKAETDLYLADEKEVLESGRIDVKVSFYFYLFRKDKRQFLVVLCVRLTGNESVKLM